MTEDILLGYFGIGVSAAFGVFGVAVGVWAVRDGRRERSKREVAVNAVHGIVGRTEGMLIGLKPSITANPAAVIAIDNGLDAIAIAKREIGNL